MEHEDIREVVEWWGRSAELTREGGFDGTEVHISHSYLLHQFLSPLYNKRDDEYGGSFENRLRFAREVIEEVRARAGNDWVVGVRISLTDFIPGALDIEDAIRVAQLLEADGRIDYVNVTAAGYHNIFRAIEPADVPDGYLVDLTARVKAGVPDLPVFTVGGIKDPAMAEEILATGKADMVAMTRAQIADPEFANKVRDGREGELVHCIRGNQGCIGRVFKGLPISCTVNPGAGRERRFGPGTLLPTDRPARWLVAGGGPAGMKAAAVLAERGHRVTLVEREDELGGQVNLILRTPGRDEFGWITRDLESQLHRHRSRRSARHRGDVRARARARAGRRHGRDRSRPLADRLLEREPTGRPASRRRPGQRPHRLGRSARDAPGRAPGRRARRRRHPLRRRCHRGTPRSRLRRRARQPLADALSDDA